MDDSTYLVLADDYFKTGTELYSAEYYEESLFYFEQVIEYNPNHTAALYYKGTLFEFGLGVIDKDLEKASQCYERGGRLGHGECSYRAGLMYYLNNDNNQQQRLQTAFEWFKLAADIGSTSAQIQISTFFQNGWVVKHNCKIALDWLLKAATKDQKSAPLNHKIAVLYDQGHDDLPQSFEKAIEWYTKTNTPESMIRIAEIYQDVFKDRAKAKAWYEKVVQSVHHHHHHHQEKLAFYKLAQLLHEEEEDSDERVFLYLLQAALLGHKPAQLEVAERYRLGKGSTGKDFQQAYHWYHTNREEPDAAYKMGLLCKEGGHGLSKDLYLALYWLRQASNKGPVLVLDLLYRELLGDAYPVVDVDPHPLLMADNNRARLYYQKAAAENNDSEAQYQLGRMALQSQNKDIARLWFTKAKDQHDGAAFELGKLLLLEDNDVELAKFYLQAAANQGNGLAALYLGKLYQEKKINDDDDDNDALALASYSEADHLGVAEAAYRIGAMQQDPEEARKWFDRARDQGFDDVDSVTDSDAPDLDDVAGGFVRIDRPAVQHISTAPSRDRSTSIDQVPDCDEESAEELSSFTSSSTHTSKNSQENGTSPVFIDRVPDCDEESVEEELNLSTQNNDTGLTDNNKAVVQDINEGEFCLISINDDGVPYISTNGIRRV